MDTPLLALTFTSGQQAACARSACKRLLATPFVRLTQSQQVIVSSVLADLKQIGTGTGGWTLKADLPHMQALHYAVTRQFDHLSDLRAPDGPGSQIEAFNEILRRMPPFAIWTDLRRPAGPDVVQFVRLGFGDLHGLPVRSLYFEVDMPDRATFEACLTDGIGSYHQFDGAATAAALGPLWNEVYAVKVCRDINPVVRIRLPLLLHQHNGSEFDTLAATVLEAAKSCGASTLVRNAAPVAQVSTQAGLLAEMSMRWTD